jgi:transposase InsO family protein
MAHEWGYGMTYSTDLSRTRALPYRLCHYNEMRPHSALGGEAPISRIRNPSRPDI